MCEYDGCTKRATEIAHRIANTKEKYTLKEKYGEVTFEAVQKMRVRATRISTEKAIAFIKEELEGSEE